MSRDIMLENRQNPINDETEATMGLRKSIRVFEGRPTLAPETGRLWLYAGGLQN
jgi:hypothetical protein